MSLKLEVIDAERTFIRRVDPYVPFDVEIGGAKSLDEVFYWRSTDARYLLELKIVASTGVVGAVSLVLVPREWTRLVESVHPTGHAIKRMKGLPAFDLAAWKEKVGNREIGVDPALRCIDEEAPFVFAIGRDGLAVSFEGGEVASMVSNGDLSFLFTKDEVLCGIVLAGLSENELKMLRKSWA